MKIVVLDLQTCDVQCAYGENFCKKTLPYSTQFNYNNSALSD